MVKWVYRLKGDKFQFEYLDQETKNAFNKNRVNVCKRMPKELVSYLNLTKSICPKYKTPNSIQHLRLNHNCVLPDLEDILQLTSPIQKAKMPRREGISRTKELIKPLLLRLS